MKNTNWMNLADFPWLPYVFKNMPGLGGHKEKLMLELAKKQKS